MRRRSRIGAGGSSAGGLRLDGIMWMIDSQLGERFSVRAKNVVAKKRV